MDTFWRAFSEAHAELMNATGWDVLLSDLSTSVRGGSGEMIRSLYANVMDFVSAVDWTEPFFTYLAVFHALVIIFVVFFTWRAPLGRIIFVDFFVLLMGWCASYLNEWGSANAAQIFVGENMNYFDPGGFFISIVYWLPLFLISLILLVRIFCGMLSLMVAYKRLQIQTEMRKQKQQQKKTEEENKKDEVEKKNS